MEINLKIKLECPELMASILALAEAIPQMNMGAMLSGKTVQAIEVENLSPVAETEVKGSKIVTLEELKEKLVYLTKAGKGKEVTALVKSFGVNKLHEVPEENYETLLKQAESIYIN